MSSTSISYVAKEAGSCLSLIVCMIATVRATFGNLTSRYRRLSLSGPIIRINPDELHVRDPVFYGTLYGAPGSVSNQVYSDFAFDNGRRRIPDPQQVSTCCQHGRNRARK